MRIADLSGRLVIVQAGTAHDVHTESGGRFSPAIRDVYERWAEFTAWAADFTPTTPGAVIEPAELGAPTPAPRQVFAIGLNYHDHAEEAGFGQPDGLPPIFTKYITSISGPVSTVQLPDGHVDWEVELAVVISTRTRDVEEQHAWASVAGLTVAQDLSERVAQMAGPAPQFSLAKSHPGFLPLGPHLVTLDEVDDPDALRLRTRLNGTVVQDGTTADLIASVPRLIAGLSRVVTLLPGDLILTGTPAGVGMGMRPPRYLSSGDLLVSDIAGLGELRQTFTR